jgi:pyruvate/2-oxoglutarate dehydrogenase complex dihydrolipoamide dehydrogenase (E3) component
VSRMNYDLIVIGGGSGGLTATQVARRLGARVLLIEKRALGGDCLFTGCVPSKTLIRTAQVAHLQRTAARYGLTASDQPIDGKRVMARVREVIAQIAKHDSIEHFTQLGAEVRIGAPQFVAADAVELDGQRLTARAFILATGSHPAAPPVDGLAETGFLTNETVFELEAIPRTLAILGGGAIGLELGQAFQRLGAKVTLVEALDRVLPKEDAECSTEIRARLEAEGVTIHTATRVARVSREGERKRLTCTQGGSPLTLDADEILVAAGRAPNLSGLGLERAGIDFDKRRVIVDDELRTTNPRVFAVGDITDRFPFTHTAGYEGAIAVRNALLPLASKADYRVIPWTTFTHPEVARVGVTEEEARKHDGAVTVLRARYTDIDRAHTDGEEPGFAKLIAVRGKIVGAHIVGAHAGELIHTPALAMKEGLKVSALASMSWVYPTLSEVVRKAAQTHYEDMLDSGTAKKVVGLLRRLKGG